jgi:hypothetical protein
MTDVEGEMVATRHIFTTIAEKEYSFSAIVVKISVNVNVYWIYTGIDHKTPLYRRSA